MFKHSIFLRICCLLSSLVGLWLPLLLWAQEADRDGDGIREEIELALGLNPEQPEQLILIHDDKSMAEGDKLSAAHRLAPDITKIWFGNVAQDRWLWRIDFAEDFQPRGTVLILYLDADNDLNTGRQDHARGVDMMLTCVDGAFAASIRNEAVAALDRQLRGVIDGKSVWMCMDMRLKQKNGRSEYRGWILCHKAEPNNADQDSTTVFYVSGPGETNKPKPPIACLSELLSENLRVLSPWLGWREDLQNMKAISLDGRKAQLKGLHISDRALVPEKPQAEALLQLSQSGIFHFAFVLQDSATGAEELQIFVNGRQIARAICAENDGLFHLFVSKKPFSVRAGDRLKLIIPEPAQDFQISEILLCPRLPQPRPLQISCLSAYCPPQSGERVYVDVCWLTNYPCTGFLHWGPGERRDQTSTVEVTPSYNHRFRLTGLTRGERYSVQIEISSGSLAERLVSEPITFVAEPAGKGKKGIGRQQIPLIIKDCLPQARGLWPLCNGVPLPQGALFSASHCRLKKPSGASVPAQFKPLAFWPDGSIKWLLISTVNEGLPPDIAFNSAVSASRQSQAGPSEAKKQAGVGEAADFFLEYGSLVSPVAEPEGLYVDEKPDFLRVVNGEYEFTFWRHRFAPPGIVRQDKNHDGRFSEDEIICEPAEGLLLTDAAGRHFRSIYAPATKLEFTEAGAVRVVLEAEGPLMNEAGKLMSWRCRLIFYRGFPAVQAVVTLLNDEGTSVMPPTITPISSFTLPLHVHTNAFLPRFRWLQMDDKELIVEKQASAYQSNVLPESLDVFLSAFAASPQAAEASSLASHSPNYIAVAPVTVAMKDFWQLYPKAFSWEGKQLQIELLPELPVNAYATHTDPKLLTQHYYWAKEGKYQLPMGVALSHDLLFVFNAAKPERWAEAFQQPVLLLPSPDYICRTGAFMDLTPEEPGLMEAWGNYVRQGFEALEATRQRVREYSYMNFGDWYGERGVNWGNLEYDLQWGLLVHFAQSGDIRFWERAEQAARHSTGIDSVNAAPQPDKLGLQYVHCLGHTGGFKMARVPDALYWYESVGFDVGHMWTQGNLTMYCLTGDERYSSPAWHLADWLAGPYTRRLDRYVHRNYGWAMIALLGAYHVNPHPYYLNAARLFADYVIAQQDPGTGVWAHPIGECTHQPKHMGGKAFMSGVVMTGLKMLDQIEPRAERKQALIRAADWLYHQMWHPQDNSFQYAQCPDFDKSSTHAGTYMACEGLAYAYALTKKPVYLDMLVRSLADVFQRGPARTGKEYAMQIRMTPYACSILSRLGVKSLPTPPLELTIHPLIHVFPGQYATVVATAHNPADTPQSIFLEITKLPPFIRREGKITKAQWLVPPRSVVTQTFFPLRGILDKEQTLQLRWTTKQARGEAVVRLRPPRRIALGTHIGYIGSNEDPLGQAGAKLGWKLPRVSDMNQETLSRYRALLIGAEGHAKNFAGLRDQPEQLIDFIYSGGRVVIWQLQDEGFLSHYLPYPLALNDADGACGEILMPQHSLFFQPHKLTSIKGAICYDTIVWADPRWQILATDQRLQPALLEASCGQGSILIVQPSFVRYVIGQAAVSKELSEETCRQFLQNVQAWLEKP